MRDWNLPRHIELSLSSRICVLSVTKADYNSKFQSNDIGIALRSKSDRPGLQVRFRRQAPIQTSGPSRGNRVRLTSNLSPRSSLRKPEKAALIQVLVVTARPG